MNKTITLGLCMAFLLVSLVSAAEEHILYINGIYFPDPTSVVLGDTVTWVNNHSITHTITDTYGYWFDSGDIAPGENWSHTFYHLGTNPYYCIYAPDDMISSIDVGLPSTHNDQNGTIPTYTPAEFNDFNSSELQSLIVESYSGVQLLWEHLNVYFTYTTLNKRFLPETNIFGVHELELFPVSVNVRTQLRYDVVQDCYEENNDNATYCNAALVTNLVPYNYDGVLISTISMQLQDRYQNIHENLIELQEYSQEYVSSQTMSIVDIQLAIIGWFT